MLYAIGDCHGRYDLLVKLYDAILEDIKKVKDPNGAEIITLGDYIDRGPMSKQVLDFLMGLQDSPEIKHVILIGNHEDFLLSIFKAIDTNVDMVPADNIYKNWIKFGGKETLKSFGIYEGFNYLRGSQSIKPYVNWLAKLPFFYTAYNYIFCHSGSVRLDFSIPLEAQRESLLWSKPARGQYIGCNKWIIHGHVPLDGKPEKDVQRINIDVGACWTNTLCAVVLPHNTCTDNDIRFIQIK